MLKVPNGELDGFEPLSVTFIIRTSGKYDEYCEKANANAFILIQLPLNSQGWQ